MKFQTQTTLSLSTLTVLLVVIAVAGYVALTTVKQLSSLYPDTLLPGILNNAEMEKKMVELQLAVVQKDSAKIQEINKNHREQIIAFAETNPNTPVGADPIVITGVSELSKAYLTLLDAALAENLQGPPSERFRNAVNGISNTQYTPDEVIDHIINVLSELINNAILQIIQLLVVASIVAVVISLTMSVFLSRRLNKALSTLTDAFKKVSLGNLVAKADDNGNDEFSVLAHYFNEVSSSLSTTIKEMAEMMIDLSDISARFKESGVSFEQRARSTSDETQMVATAMTEMAATIREVAQNAENTARQAQDANSQADSARLLINNSVSRSKQLQTQMGGISDQVLQLKEKTQSISTVIDVIQGIAEQTNLLALNAAIEAARAGEQGRGFAVVADEVRTLATRTATSTQEIVDVIKALQSMAENTSTQIAQGTDDVEKNAKAIAEINEGLASILTNISSISDMNHQIATNSQEQSHVAEDMNTNIVRISDLAEQNAAQTEQINADITLIDSLTQHVKKLVGKFQY